MSKIFVFNDFKLHQEEKRKEEKSSQEADIYLWYMVSYDTIPYHKQQEELNQSNKAKKMMPGGRLLLRRGAVAFKGFGLAKNHLKNHPPRMRTVVSPLASRSHHHHRLLSSSAAPPMDDSQKQVIRDLFWSYARLDNDDDVTKPPHLDTEQLSDLLHAIGEFPTDERLEELIQQVDRDGNGTIEYEEFLEGCDKVLNTASLDADQLIQTFNTLDTDGNGVITTDELEGLLSTTGGSIDKKIAKEILHLADTDKSGGIDLAEFLDFLTHHPHYSWRLTSGFRSILVIGGPGSGKGVLCDRLVREANIHHFSSGELLRDEVSARTPLGLQVEGIMKAGQLLPSSTMIALVKKKISSFPGAMVAFDGFPRSRENYQDFDLICGAPEFAISIEVPDEVLVERMLKRGQESGRVDDNLETAKKRIRTFHEMGDPTLQCLRESGIPIYTLDGSKSMEEVWDQLLRLDTPLTKRVLK